MTLHEANTIIAEQNWALNDLHSQLVAHEALLVRLGLTEDEAAEHMFELERAATRAEDAVRAATRARAIRDLLTQDARP
jgi:peptidoglycan hydrolase CwlO-like protein